jgi:hypothetical protein
MAGSGLGLLPGEETPPDASRKKKQQKKAPAAVKKAPTPRAGGAGAHLSPLAIALTLCDSLRDAAYQGWISGCFLCGRVADVCEYKLLCKCGVHACVYALECADCWGSHAARSKWKELIAKPGNDLAAFGSHMRFFESRSDFNET